MCWDVTEYLYVVASSTSLVVSSSHAARAAFEKFEEGISQSKRRMMRAIMGGRDRGRERLLRRWRGEEWEAVAPFALTVSSNRLLVYAGSTALLGDLNALEMKSEPCTPTPKFILSTVALHSVYSLGLACAEPRKTFSQPLTK